MKVPTLILKENQWQQQQLSSSDHRQPKYNPLKSM